MALVTVIEHRGTQYYEVEENELIWITHHAVRIRAGASFNEWFKSHGIPIMYDSWPDEDGIYIHIANPLLRLQFQLEFC